MVYFQKRDTGSNIPIYRDRHFIYWYLHMIRPDHSVDINVSYIFSDTSYRNLEIFIAKPNNLSEKQHINQSLSKKVKTLLILL